MMKRYICLSSTRLMSVANKRSTDVKLTKRDIECSEIIDEETRRLFQLDDPDVSIVLEVSLPYHYF